MYLIYRETNLGRKYMQVCSPTYTTITYDVRSATVFDTQDEANKAKSKSKINGFSVMFKETKQQNT